jgi:hypothetical protein
MPVLLRLLLVALCLVPAAPLVAEPEPGIAGDPVAPAAPVPVPVPGRDQLLAWIDALSSDDMDTRRDAAAALMKVGEPVLPVIEEAVRTGRARPLGQVKIVLLDLQATREERLWTERIMSLGAQPQAWTYHRLKARHVEATLSMLTRLTTTDDMALVEFRDVDVETRKRDAVTLVSEERARPEREFSVVSFEVRDDATLRTALTVEGRDATGQRDGFAVTLEKLPRPLVTPAGVLRMVTMMPLKPESEVYFSMIDPASGVVTRGHVVRCAGREKVAIRSTGVECWRIEHARGDAGDGPWVYWVSDDRVLLKADRGDLGGLELSRDSIRDWQARRRGGE